jgi:hypothetical protein
MSEKRASRRPVGKAGETTPPSEGTAETGSITNHVLYERTKNPLWVWREVMLALAPVPAQPGRQIPEWCLDYLSATATAIMRLAERRMVEPHRQGETDQEFSSRIGARGDDSFPIDGPRALGLVPQALGFSSRGRNRFDEMAADMKAAGEALLVNALAMLWGRSVVIKERYAERDPDGQKRYLDPDGMKPHRTRLRRGVRITTMLVQEASKKNPRG